MDAIHGPRIDCFPTVPSTITPRECYSINRIRHNRGKACLSGKRRALEGSPKIYCGSTSFCHSYRTRTGSNTRKLSKSKKLSVVLREIVVCTMPEIPSFTYLMILQTIEKLQRNANEFSNPE